MVAKRANAKKHWRVAKKTMSAFSGFLRMLDFKRENDRAPLVLSTGASDSVRFVCISDTHSMHSQLRGLPPGDVLIHCGDFTMTGKEHEIRDFNAWLEAQPYKVKLVVAGNHEVSFQPDFYEANWDRWHDKKLDSAQVKSLLTAAVYLEDTAVVVDGIRLYGSPWQPWFMNWAFNVRDRADLRDKWDAIPDDTDVLVTHAPPFGHGDVAKQNLGNVGCPELLKAVQRVKPKYHVFGHVHESGGAKSRVGPTTCVNVSICDGKYKPWNPPFSFALPKVVVRERSRSLPQQ